MILTQRQFHFQRRLLRSLQFQRRVLVNHLQPFSSPGDLEQALGEHDQRMAAIETDLDDYRQMQAGRSQHPDLESVREIPAKLIRARLIAGLTQRRLAELVGIAEGQIQRYESTGYRSASLGRVITISQALAATLSRSQPASGPTYRGQLVNFY